MGFPRARLSGNKLSMYSRRRKKLNVAGAAEWFTLSGNTDPG